MDWQNIEVSVREANGDPEYKFCNRQHLIDGTYKPNFGIVASNYKAKNDIDINAIYMKNMDPRAYRNKEKLNQEYLVLVADKNIGLVDEEGNMKAHDLLSV